MPCIHWHARPWWRKHVRMPAEHGVILFPRKLGDEERIQYFKELDQFLARMTGFYVADSIWPLGKETCKFHEIGSHYKFTDPNTAFAFKMQFYRSD